MLQHPRQTVTLISGFTIAIAALTSLVFIGTAAFMGQQPNDWICGLAGAAFGWLAAQLPDGRRPPHPG